MKKQERCVIPVFFAVLASVLTMVGGCGRETGFRFETAEAYTEQESVPVQEVSEEGQTGTDGPAATVAETSPAPETIWVYVCGAVHVPGVYELPSGGRVYQALEAAGGVLDNAELRSLNQAALLTDGEQITVYTAQEWEESGGVPEEEMQNGTGKVNLNTAGAEELMTLSGIGEARAKSIISYREENGPFTAIEDVMNIGGIKEKAFDKIKDEIEV